MTDTEKLLAILRDHPGWVSHYNILHYCQLRYGHGMTIHSRAADLRKTHNVECKVERIRSRRLSYYRLVT